MNRTDRLLAIVLELQGRDVVSAESLAQSFEVTKRTIYRDISALVEAGVPIVSAPGQGYWLMEGYFLPPLSFNKDEATLLLLGSEVMAQSFDNQYKEVALSATKKISAILDEALSMEVNYLKENIRFLTFDAHLNSPLLENLQIIRSAVINKHSLTFRYISAFAQITNRKLDPYGLYYVRGIWMVTGYCHLRETRRIFRLDRIEALKLSKETFERKNFALNHFEEPRALHITLEFKPEIRRWVKERPSFYITSMFEDKAGVIVELQTRKVEDVLYWILSWGSHVKVLSPKELRDKIQEEARKMLEAS